MDDDEEEITVDFQSYNPDFVDADAGDEPKDDHGGSGPRYTGPSE